jgi:multiple sugar transport system substrate-binding protein
MSRKAIVYAGIVTVLLLASVVWFLATRGNGNPSPPIVLHIIGEDYSPMRGLEKIKGRFTAETGTQVDIVRVDAETLRKRYLGEFQSGASNYDVIMGQAFDVGLLAVNGWPLDVSEALTRPGWRDPKLDLSNFSDQLLDLSCRYKGKLYGLPCSAQCMFLWYRKDLFSDPGERESFARRYGYPLPQPTPARSMTWKEYRDVAEFFTRPKGAKAAGQALTDDLFGTVLQGKNHIALWFEFQNFLGSFGGSFIAADGKTVEAAAPPARQALDYYLGLKPFAPPGMVNYSWDEALAAFQNGQVVTAIMWSDSISAVEDPKSSRVAGRVGYAANPTLEEGGRPASVFGGWGLFVNRRSRHPKEALQLIQWANRPDVQVAWAKVGGFPAALSAYDAPDLREIPGMAAHREALKHLVAWTREPYSARLVEIGQNNLAKAVAGEATPDAALQEIAARYQAILQARPQ